MGSKVYFLNARSLNQFGSLSAVKTQVLLDELEFPERVTPDSKVCVKTHFGALSNTRYMRPSYARLLVDYVKQLRVEDVYVAESCGAGMPHGDGLYAGRAAQDEYLECAKRHGFTPDTMGCPVTMLDGEVGLDWFPVKVPGKYFKEIMVAGKLEKTDLLIMHTHFKGHGTAGFGGA
ncbi:DUF362 domain-containing protein, partial [Candidatus Bathyarchaeota archaeon]|nr:DUF362 domain-containing protein [Candidatus Bathyarchaeota archaeon]